MCPLGILCQEGGEAVTLRGVGAGAGDGLLACRAHAASHRRQALAIDEDNDVHGLVGVYLLQGSVSDECPKAGLVLAHIACGAFGGAFGRHLGVFARRVCRL